MTEAPAGYTSLKVCDIRKACEAAKIGYAKRAKEWEPTVAPALRDRLGFWTRLDMLLDKVPKDTQKLVAWYMDMRWWERPRIPNLEPEPMHGTTMEDWGRRVTHMSEETSVLVCIDDAHCVTAWLQ